MTTPAEHCFDLDEVADLYAARAERVRRQVQLGVVAPEAVIDDACQIAWSRLVRDRVRVRRNTAQAWLVKTAVHEALKLAHRQARDLSLDGLLETAGDVALGLEHTPASAVHEVAERRARLHSIGDLPVRQQRLVWLRGLGLSYEEIAASTGDTLRTVERQLLRANQGLRRLGEDDDLPAAA